MTYIYRFTINETGQCYVGQHRSSCNDPYKDKYKGSGVAWTSLLKDYDLWEIKKFRKGVQKEILKIWYEDVSREDVGKAEKEVIEETREIYGGLFSDFCVNISGGSLPSWVYDTQEEAYNARKEWLENHKEYFKEKRKEYYENHKEELKAKNKEYRENHKEEIKEYNKKYCENHKEELKAKNKEYRENHKEYYEEYYEEYNQLSYVKISKKVDDWGRKHNYPSPEVAIFPESWGEAEITEYKRQWENRK